MNNKVSFRNFNIKTQLQRSAGNEGTYSQVGSAKPQPKQSAGKSLTNK